MKKLYNEVPRTVIDHIPYSPLDVSSALLQDKPTEIYNTQYSSKTPLYYLTWRDDGFIEYTCASHADKMPIVTTVYKFVDILDILNTAYEIPVDTRFYQS